MKESDEQNHVSICGIWFGDISNGILRAEKQLRSIIRHLRDCAVDSDYIIYRLIVNDRADEWRRCLSIVLAEESRSLHGKKIELKIIDLSDFLVECEASFQHSNARVVRDLTKMVSFHCVHPIAQPNYAAASDIIRLFCMARWGGVYLDLDNRFFGTCPSSHSPPGKCCLVKSSSMGNWELAYGTHEMEEGRLSRLIDETPPACASLIDEARGAADYIIQSCSLSSDDREEGRKRRVAVPVNGILCLSLTERPDNLHPIGVFLVEELHRNIVAYFREELATSIDYWPKGKNRPDELLPGPKLSVVLSDTGQFYSSAYLHGPVFLWKAIRKLNAPGCRGRRPAKERPRTESIETTELLTYPPGIRPEEEYTAPERSFSRPRCRLGEIVYPPTPYSYLGYSWINYKDYPAAEDYYDLITLMEEISGTRFFKRDAMARRFSEKMKVLIDTYRGGGRTGARQTVVSRTGLEESSSEADLENLIIVAHPDDETIFFGDFLRREAKHTKVVCVTCGTPRTTVYRSRKFREAMGLFGCRDYEIWRYLDRGVGCEIPDRRFAIVDGETVTVESSLEAGLRRVLSENEYKKVVTHNDRGEYGHPHHKQIHCLVKKVYERPFYVFKQGETLSDKACRFKEEAARIYSSDPRWLFFFIACYGAYESLEEIRE